MNPEFFIYFLEHHNALQAFERSFGCSAYSETFMAILRKRNPCFWLSFGFRWSETPDGRLYWKSLNDLWLQLVL